MPNRINANEIKIEFDRIIIQADTIDSQLAQRLRQLSRWIKNKKTGLLTRKRLVMDLIIEVIILSQSAIDSALETLKANRRYQQNKLAHDLDRVDLYVDDVEGDWLDNWTDNAEDNEEIDRESISPSAVE